MAGIPQVITSDRASGAQVIDGSLKFDDDSSQYLNRTPSSAGNKTVWSFSFWIKLNKVDGQRQIFSVYNDSSNDSLIKINSNGYLEIWNYIGGAYKTQYISNARFRDHSAWYNFVISCNGSTSLSAWVNGVAITFSTSTGPDGTDWLFNDTNSHQIGRYNTTANSDFQLTQVNWIDGQALGPEEFGYTDGLTNTWKPKKYEGTFGTNGFWLPMDGNSPIGEDRSGIVNPNTGTFWSAFLASSSGFRSSEPVQNAFDGDTSSICSAVDNGTITFTSPVTFASDSTIKVVVHGGDHTVTVNGGADQTISAGSLQTVTYSNSGNATFVMTFKRDTSADTGVRAIEINGHLLIDNQKGNSWIPQNFGGSIELEKATGAKPILNTTQGGTQAGVGVFGSRENVGYAVTVGPKTGGGNAYYIDGVERPTLTGLIRGATYTFDTSDSTVSSTHPFRLSATSAHGTEYTNGVAAITGAATTITIPHDAPESLYYYCTAHSGMGSSITGITTNEKLADQYASHCTLALPLVGVSNDVSVSVACTNASKTVTVSNAVASNDKSNFYLGSWYFDGTSDKLTVPYSAADFDFGTGDFTIEAYVYLNQAVQYTAIISSTGSSISNDNDWLLGMSNTDHMMSFRINTSGNSSITSNFQQYYGKWTHVAVSRQSGVVRLFFDGVQKASATDTSNLTGDTDNAVKIGQRYTDTDEYSWNGYMQDIRVYKGVAKYTNNFIPAATSPDILPDTPSGVSGGSKLTKITEGAVSFDGSDDYLSLAHNSDFDMYDSIYTWDLFFYTTDLSSGTDDEGYGTLFSQCTAGSSVSYGLGFDGSGNLSFKYWNGSSTVSTTATTKIGTNKWYHVAIVKDTASATSGNTKIFLDGKLEATTAVSGTFHNSTNLLEIGADRRSGGGSYDYFQGQISNLRAVKGTALYTSSFTPPTAPLTNVTNTKLLCCQSNSEGPQKTAVIPSVTGTATAMWPLDSDINDDSGNSNNLSENGGSTSFTSAGTNPFGLSNCADFAADGKYLSYAVTPASAWTIDGYIKFDDVSSGSNSYVLGWNGTNGSDTTIGLTKSNSTFTVWGSSNLSTATVAETGRWYHVRLTTNGTTDLALYVDGVLAGRSTSSDGSPASPITIGDMQSGRFNGQIAGVRYTPTDLGAPPLGGETTSSGVTSNSPSAGVGLAGDVAATNFNPFNTDINTVRGQETGYPTMSPLAKNSSITLTDGNLHIASTGNHGDKKIVYSNAQIPNDGKWYVEWHIGGPGCTLGFGMNGKVEFGGSDTQLGTNTYSWGYEPNGNLFHNGNQGGSYGASSAGDVIGMTIDTSGSTITAQWYENGVLIRNSSGAAAEFTGIGRSDFVVMMSQHSPNYDTVVNFGQKPFKFPPPDGFQPLNAANTRPVKVISRPKDYVGVATYDGSGNSFQEINVGFKPDFVWCKCVEAGENHALFDSVRGPTKILRSDSTDNQYNIAAGTPISFGPNGFIFTNGSGEINESGRAYVGLAWRAGGAPTADNTQTSGAMTANSVSIDGVLQSAYTPSGSPSTYPKRMSVGTDQGFSIVQFVGNASNRTLPHGLGKAPKFMIVKNMDTDATGWAVYHDAIGTATDNYIELQVTTAADTDNTAFQDTAPTSDVFSIGTKAATNNDTDDTIAYIWADVPGMQKFGQFAGNNSSDGVFVELGFKPKILLIKNYDSTGDWIIWDAARNPFNPVNRQIWPYTTSGTYGDYDQVSANYPLDFLSNGFKMRTADADMNGNRNYFYAAWAEAPSVNLYGGGANAR